MTKGTKIGIAIGVLGAVGVAVYFLLKPKNGQNGALAQVDENGQPTGSTLKSGGNTNTSAPATCSGYKMGYLSERPKEIPVHFASPRPAKGTFDKNNVVQISNTGANGFDGNYVVKSVWIDSSGNVGAIYIDIPFKPKGKDDRTFQDIGCITKIS